MHKDMTNRGYIAMLSVHKNWRKRGIGDYLCFTMLYYVGSSLFTASTLVRRSIEVMKANGVEEVCGPNLLKAQILIKQ